MHIEEINKIIRRKLSNNLSAELLGLSVNEYLSYKKNYYKNKDNKNIMNYKNTDNKKTVNYNLETGTGTLAGLVSNRPLSADEIIQKYRINTKEWKLSAYWNKEVGNDKYYVSANITKLKEGEINIDQIEAILEKKKNIFQNSKTFDVYEGASNSKTLIIYLSDKHVGAIGGHLYGNEYDNKVYYDRMMEILEQIKKQVYIHGEFDRMVIVDLGDRADGLNGQTTRKSHPLPQNMTNEQMFDTAVGVDIMFYNTLFSQAWAKKYEVYNLANSNHGGAGIDYFIGRSIDLYIKASYPKVKCTTAKDFLSHIIIDNHVFILTHGKDDKNMKHGFPLKLDHKTENYFNKYLLHHRLNPQDYTIHIIKGDLHQSSSQRVYGYRYKNIPSVFGSSDWVETNFGPGYSGFSMDIIEKGEASVTEKDYYFKLQAFN